MWFRMHQFLWLTEMYISVSWCTAVCPPILACTRLPPSHCIRLPPSHMNQFASSSSSYTAGFPRSSAGRPLAPPMSTPPSATGGGSYSAPTGGAPTPAAGCREQGPQRQGTFSSLQRGSGACKPPCGPQRQSVDTDACRCAAAQNTAAATAPAHLLVNRAAPEARPRLVLGVDGLPHDAHAG